MSPASLPTPTDASTLVGMSAARVSRAQQLRTRLKAINRELPEAETAERALILEQAAKVERDYLQAERERKRFVKAFLATPASERTVEVLELAEAMGLSKARLYQINKLG